MKAIILKILDFLKRRRLKSFGSKVSVGSSTRLLRGFNIRFLASPIDRQYVAVGECGVLNATFVFESTTGRISIGNRCYIGVNSSLISRDAIEIGDDVTIAWGVTIYDHDSHSKDWRDRRNAVQHFYDKYGQPECFDSLEWNRVKSAPIVICDKVWVGFDVVILKGVTIGEGAIVAARSVVTRDVEAFTVVGGNPAKKIGIADENRCTKNE